MLPDPGPARRRRRRIHRVVVALVFLVVADQLANYLVLGDGWLLGVRVAPFDPPVFCQGQLDVLRRLERELATGPEDPGLGGAPDEHAAADEPARSRRFDVELGWSHAPSSGSGRARFDELGARVATVPLTRARRAGVRRVLAMGCSFTYGTEVAADQSWPAQLAALRDDLEVVNLGVPGYGLDQAFLRWRRDGRDLDADDVWVGFFPAAARRNVSQYRPAVAHYSPSVALKPRFELAASGQLTLIPQPARDLADLVRLVGDGAAFVAAVTHDDFVRRVRPAYLPRGTHWTHYSALGRVAWTLVDRSGRDVAARLRDTEDEIFQVTVAIGRDMAQEVGAAGSRFRILVLPGRDGLERRAADGSAPWQAAVDAWRAGGIEVVDLTDALVAAGAPSEPALWAEGGHYSPRANAVVARALEPR